MLQRLILTNWDFFNLHMLRLHDDDESIFATILPKGFFFWISTTKRMSKLYPSHFASGSMIYAEREFLYGNVLSVLKSVMIRLAWPLPCLCAEAPIAPSVSGYVR